METLVFEIRNLASRIAGLRSILLHLVLLAAFGILIPRMKGLDFLDSQVLCAYVCLGLLFAAPAAAQAFPEGKETPFKSATARILACVLYGEFVTLTLAACGIGIVYLSLRGSYAPPPDWETLAHCALLGLAGSLTMASIAALGAVQFSRNMAMLWLRVAFFGLLVLFFYKGRWLPDVGWSALAPCLVLTSIFLGMLKKACK
jgi:hypothetical protein